MKTENVQVEELIEACKSLTTKEREVFLAELLKLKQFREDLVDLAIIEQRREEKSHPFCEYLAGKS